MKERKLYVIIPQSCWKLFTPNNYKVDKWCSEYVHKHKHNKPRRANRPNRTKQNKNWNFLMTVVQYIFNWLEAPIDCIFLYFFRVCYTDCGGCGFSSENSQRAWECRPEFVCFFFFSFYTRVTATIKICLMMTGDGPLLPLRYHSHCRLLSSFQRLHYIRVA